MVNEQLTAMINQREKRKQELELMVFGIDMKHYYDLPVNLTKEQELNELKSEKQKELDEINKELSQLKRMLEK